MEIVAFCSILGTKRSIIFTAVNFVEKTETKNGKNETKQEKNETKQEKNETIAAFFATLQ